MKILVLSLLLCLAASVRSDCPNGVSQTTTSGIFHTRGTQFCSGELIFEDNFENFDLATWQHENTLSGGGNWEFQYYNNNRTNSYVENGYLHIRPTYLSDDVGEDFLYSGTLDVNGGLPVDTCSNAAFYGCSRTGTATNVLNPIKSARIRTSESFSFKYGSVVVRAKMPSGDWLWPAIWLLPRYNAYGVWPQSGEIDLVESRGNKNLVNSAGVNVGSQQVSSTLHWGPNYFFDEWSKSHYEKNNAAGYDADFHVYKLVWSPDSIIFYIDNEEIGTVAPPSGGFWELGLSDSGETNPWKAGSKMAPFDQEFYLIINLAVGGTNFFSDEYVNNGGKPWSNTSPAAATDFWKGRSQWESTWNLGTDDSHLIVDYVQVYAI
ncbi:beta-1,3-glucan-binding protein-like [Anthonomus grandis grandis]|uniref:beta-1,3-glucan-binding protein-like n=1 Tax=Anthonomus grandis grandis TaxID=2921223 RepID=UPI00216584AC|nr:beta-1,3-glucan-binding protein-like [Anthonomus grandis grandis]